MFQDGGIQEYFKNPKWLQAIDVDRMEVMDFPPAVDIKLRSWKTVDSNH